jgi:hypothetical protein
MHLVHYKDQMTNNEKRQGSVCARMQAPKAWDILQELITKALMWIWQTNTNVIPERFCNASGYFRVALVIIIAMNSTMVTLLHFSMRRPTF